MEENEEQFLLLDISKLPRVDPPKKKERRKSKNIMGEMLRSIMDDLKLKDAEVVRATGVPFASWHGWITDHVVSPLADDNLFNLYVYLNQFKRYHLEYILFGIGEPEELEKDDVA